MRPSVRPSTAWMAWRRTITCSSQSATSTPMTTFTQTLAWCTSYAELAHGAHSCTPVHVVSHLIGSRSESCHEHLHSDPWAHLLESPLPFYFHLFFSVFFFSFHFLHSELCPELDNLIVMESLCSSANKGSDTYDVSTYLTGYEPNFMTFGELNDSSGSFSYIIPSSDQDMDVTLGKLLTEAHWGQADYCEPEGVSVSQSVVVVCCVPWIREPWWRKKCRPIRWFWGHEKHVQCSQQVFWNTRTEKMVDGSGKPDERNSSSAQIREISEFCIRHHGKTKIHRGPGHYFGTYWQDTGFAKWN